MAKRTLIKGGTVITVDRELVDVAEGDVLIEDGAIVAVGRTIEAGDAEVIDATLAVESRDDIMRRADGRSGARLGGDWIPHPYEGAEV